MRQQGPKKKSDRGTFRVLTVDLVAVVIVAVAGTVYLRLDLKYLLLLSLITFGLALVVTLLIAQSRKSASRLP